MHANAIYISYEKYFGSTAYVAVAFFYKDLKTCTYTRKRSDNGFTGFRCRLRAADWWTVGPGPSVTYLRDPESASSVGGGDISLAGLSNYANVVYASKFANAPQPVRELASFHLDDDQTWRVSGYSLR